MVDTYGRYKTTRQIAARPPLYLLVAISDLYLQIPHSGMWIKCQIADYVPLMQ